MQTNFIGKNIIDTRINVLYIIFYFRISFGLCGRFTAAELMSFFLSFILVCVWVLTGHWLLMDGKWIIRLNFFIFKKRKLLKVCTRFVLKTHLTATDPYIRAKNSSTGCTSVHRRFYMFLHNLFMGSH